MPQPPNRAETLRRIHAVQDYIENNLGRAPQLRELADVAGFSKFHFHRLYHALTGETLLQYLNRVRLERAAAYLAHNPSATMTDIAYHYGFADPAVFSRAFKARYGLSPTAYRRESRKNCKAEAEGVPYNESVPNTRYGSDGMDAKPNAVDVKNETLRVIYVRFTGSYPELAKAMPEMMRKLYRFAVDQKLLKYGQTKILCAYHDNPELTEDARLRVSLCMSVPEDAHIGETDEIGVMSFGGSFGVGHFELYQQEYPAAWRYMYGEWLADSGYQPRDAFPFEVYVSDPSKNPGGKQLLDVYVPVEPIGPI